jgi:hypothetical protein
MYLSTMSTDGWSFTARLTTLESRPAPQDGHPGRDGTNGINGLPGRDGTDGQPGPPGQAGQDGVNGHNGDNGRDGVNGVDGIPGVAGKDGLPGKDGKDGQPGRDGTNGINGSPGENGRDGSHGIDGSPGVPGQDGLPGKDGKDGPPGPTGKDGKDGINGLNGDNGRDGKDGQHGAPGKDGQPGRDGSKGEQGERGPIGERGPPGSSASGGSFDLTQPIPGPDQVRVYMVHINRSSMVRLGEGTGLVFSGINGQFTGQFVETSSTGLFNTWTTLRLHDNTPVTSEYAINIPPIPSRATTLRIIPTLNYSLRFTGPFSFILVRRPREDTSRYTFTEHSIPRGLVRILTSNIETPNLCLPFSQPPAVRSNLPAIVFDGPDQSPANPEPVGVLIAVSKLKNLSMVRIRRLPNPSRDGKLCLHWDIRDNSGDTIFSRFGAEYSGHTELFDPGSTYWIDNPIVLKDILGGHLSPYLHIIGAGT